MNGELKRYKIWLAACAALLTACSQTDNVEQSTGTPLKVELSAITRAPLMGKTLPDGSEYGIFVTDNEDNFWTSRSVAYNNGVSSLNSPVMLDKTLRHVYAVYPSKNSINTANMELTFSSASQVDYLYGAALDNEAGVAAINEDNPVARIYMFHAMSMIRFRVTRSEDNDEYCSVEGVTVGDVYTQATASILTGETEPDAKSLGKVSMGTKFYASPTTPTDIDILLVPQTISEAVATFTVDNNYLSVTLPKTDCYPGNIYVFNVSIRNRGRLEISEAEILPREEGEGGSYVIPYAQQ